MYSEKSKVPWSALVVGGAVLVFGSIVTEWRLARNLLPGGLSLGAPGAGEPWRRRPGRWRWTSGRPAPRKTG